MFQWVKLFDEHQKLSVFFDYAGFNTCVKY